jgi:hypothetical protein
MRSFLQHMGVYVFTVVKARLWSFEVTLVTVSLKFIIYFIFYLIIYWNIFLIIYALCVDLSPC